ncbi:MAG TPA: hypothetical protein VJ927_09635 [Actinomycetota bacterium]|nr:hypothetical protein [Actinomycetota bacterium]
MTAEAVRPPSHQETSTARFVAGTRVAGAVIALGHLLGLVPGSVVAVVGALAMITFGRALLLDARAAMVAGGALAVVGGALGIAALRWGALGLPELRGVQSVLGPTLLVGPVQAAVATGIAAGAAVVALAVWLSAPWPADRLQYIWSALEAGIAALAVVTVFFDPAKSALGSGGATSVVVDIALWTAAVLVTGLVAAAAAWGLRHVGMVWRLAAVALAGTAVTVAAALLVSVI